jgi:hypothetical protein
MSPSIAKLLMCVCAGTTGATVVPAIKHGRALLKPRPAVHRPVALPVQASPCPAAAVASSGGGDMPIAGIGGFASLGEAQPIDIATLGSGGALGKSLGGVAFDRGLFPGAGGGIPPADFGSLSSTAPGPGVPPGAGAGLLAATPVTSGAPEPAGWTLMISGFGLLGGAMRWQRRGFRLRADQAQAISSSSISALGSPFQSSRLTRPAA